MMEPRSYLAAHVAGSSTVYSTIQAAVDAAMPGGIVTVDAGTYAEQVTVTKQLTIEGAKTGVDARTRATTNESIVGGATYNSNKIASFLIYANDVTIDGFSIQGETSQSTTSGAGIVIEPNVAGTHIVNNIIQNNVAGVFLANSSASDPAVFQHNLFQNNNNAGANGGRGIYTDGSLSGGQLTNVLIDANTFINNKGGSGTTGLEAAVAFEAGTAGEQTNITITNNTFTNNGKSVLFFNTTGVLLQGNTATGAADWYSGSFRFEGNDHNVTIQYNNILNNPGPGVAVDSSGANGDSSGFVVQYNDITNNGTNSTYTARLGVVYNQTEYDGTFDARNNYWNAASGPSGDGPGTGDGVYGNAYKTGHWMVAKGGSELFAPFATAPINITAVPVPTAPSLLKLAINSSTSITLNWTAPSSTASSQLVQRSTDGMNFVTVATVAPLINTYTDASLSSGTNYVYRIVASNSTGTSTSNIASTAPTTPAGLAAGALSASTIKLTWQAPGTAPQSYTLQRSIDGTTFTSVATNIAGSATTYTDAGLSAGTTYYYRLIAVTATGSSAASNVATSTTLSANAVSTPLSSLNWTSATTGYGTIQKNLSISGNTITLRGKTYTSGIGTHAASTITYNLGGKYNVFNSDVGIDDEVGVNSGAAVQFQVYGDGVLLFDSGILNRSSPITSVSVSVAGVQTLTLVATNGVPNNIDYDHSDFAGATLVANPVAPSAPTNLTATATSSTAVALSWTAGSSNQTGYKLDRSSDGGTTWATIASPTGTTYTDTGLTAGMTYDYRVRATNSAGDSPNSNVATATPAVMTRTYLSDLSWTSATAGYGTVQKDQTINGNTITLRGVKYAKGLGTHAVSTITYNLNGQYNTFLSDVGVDDEENGVGTGSVDFQVVGDGKVLFDSGIVTNASPTVSISVSVAGVKTLQLIATNGVQGSIDYDHADWAGAQLLSQAQTPAAPTSMTAAATSTTAARIGWASPATDLTGFTIDRSTNGTTWTTIATVAGNVFTYLDTSLAAGTTYSYRVRATNSAGTSVNSAVAATTTLAANAVVTNLSSLNWTSATAGYGTVQKDQTIKGNTITLRGTTYASGIGTHAASTITYNLAGGYKTFLSDIGVDDEENGVGTGSVEFEVMGDGKLLYDSGVLTNASPITSLNVDVTGVQTLTIIATNGVSGSIDYDHADWAGAKLVS